MPFVPVTTRAVLTRGDTGLYASHVTAVSSADITDPTAWEVLDGESVFDSALFDVDTFAS